MKDIIIINEIHSEHFNDAVEIFTEGFSSDPLHLHLFPDYDERLKVTRCIYEMMVYDIVPGLNLRLKGIYCNGSLCCCLIYTRPDSYEWNESMMDAVNKMREKANNSRVKSIGEYAMLVGHKKPKEDHVYLNELSVRKGCRRKGYARMLIENAEKDITYFPKTELIALDTTNYLNVEIYKKIGYNVIEEFNFSGVNCFLMRKKIPKTNL